jgi:ribosomal protein S18 acetylase RimI-like enzyme
MKTRVSHDMANVCIRVFQPHEWRIYRDLRLRALQDAPDAFGATLADERAYADDFWSSRLHAACAATDLPLVAELDDRPAGLAWGRIEPSNRDTAYLYQMWVAPECRGLGAGSMLLQAVIDWAGSQHARFMILGVTCGNSAATKLYTAAGFTPVGEPEPLRPGGELLAQSMKLDFSPLTDAGP